MLRRVNERITEKVIPGVRIADAQFPAPFRSGLEYSSPARGTWNIVHTGMLIPGAHEIYVCAAGCLRGVVLTAAEMGTADRFSTIAIREHDLLDGGLEYQVIDGVADIIGKLPSRPPAVLVYTSCVHHFAGCDLDMIYDRLREMFPDIDFTDCYMNPIMRKSGLTPDQLMRSRLYTLLHERPVEPDAVAIIGNDLPTREDSDLMIMLRRAGKKIHEITSCRTYEEYQEMAESAVYISYNADAVPGGRMLSERLGGKHHFVQLSFDFDEIDRESDKLADVLGVPRITEEEKLIRRDRCRRDLAVTRELIGDTPVTIDYTYCQRPLGLAAMLLDNGFNVTKVYLDGVTVGDKKSFEYLQKAHPDLMLHPTVHTGMRFAQTVNNEKRCGKILAIGQKAAYFENTDNFVNVVEGGGMLGYEAVTGTLALMRDAFSISKDMRALVQVKGLGCEVCLR